MIRARKNVNKRDIFNTSWKFDQDLWLCSHQFYSTDRNSLSIRVLVLESWSSPLEKQSEEEERLQVLGLSWEVKTCPRMMSHCRKRKMTQSSRSWRNSRRIPPGAASGGHCTGGEERLLLLVGAGAELATSGPVEVKFGQTLHYN